MGTTAPLYLTHANVHVEIPGLDSSTRPDTVTHPPPPHTLFPFVPLYYLFFIHHPNGSWQRPSTPSPVLPEVSSTWEFFLPTVAHACSVWN